jgi:alpha-galactosidase
MRPVFLFCLTAGWLVCQAADINGSWVSVRELPGGRKVETQFNFKQTGNTFTGSILSQNGEQPIVNGTVDGNAITFEVVTNLGGQERRMKYEGKLEGEELKLTIAGFPGGGGAPRPPQPGAAPGGPPPGGAPGAAPGGPPPGAGGGRGFREMTARRGISETLKKQAEADARRPKTQLPELKTLPPNGLAKTPPMGWNSWNLFRTNINDKLIREIADAFVTSGMKDAGYVFINIDDGWQGERDEKGVLHPNSNFGDMKALADYVHSKGLKLGIYSSPGPRTCAQYEGSLGYEAIDAKTYADWGIDYLKYDWCSAARIYPMTDQQRAYQLMAEYLRRVSRPIVFAICQYGANNGPQWAASAGGNLWRTTGDIRAAWDSMTRIGFGQNGLEKYAGPGHWNDPDMLEVGNPGLSVEESRTHFSLWCLLAAPLLAGNDVRNMPAEVHDILTNKEVIAVDQDALGKQGYRVAQDGEAEVWAKPLSRNRWACGLFNRSNAPMKVTVKWADLSVKGSPQVRDLWQHKDLGKIADSYTAEVPSHGVVMLQVRP